MRHQHVRRTRTSLKRALHTAYRGTTGKEHGVGSSAIRDRRRRHTTSSLPSTTHLTPQRTSSTSLHVVQSALPHSGGGAGVGGGGADEAAAALSAAFSSAMSALDLNPSSNPNPNPNPNANPNPNPHPNSTSTLAQAPALTLIPTLTLTPTLTRSALDLSAVAHVAGRLVTTGQPAC